MLSNRLIALGYVKCMTVYNFAKGKESKRTKINFKVGKYQL